MNISRTKVRKILITMGVIQSEIADKALPLIQNGMSLKEIFEKLNISIATLSNYLPYGNRVYSRENRTNDAIRSKQYKERQKNAANKQVHKAETRKETMIKQNTAPSKVYHLHLELKGTKYNTVLYEYGRAFESVSRDILVSENYSLHALHYAIQKMFGWQNSYLHHFRFSEDLMDKLISNSYKTYSRLVVSISAFLTMMKSLMTSTGMMTAEKEEALKPGLGQSTAVSTAIWEAMNTIMLLKLQLMNSMKHTRYLE